MGGIRMSSTDTKQATGRISFPIRFKILVTLLVVITAVLVTITFTMARFFHEDKRAYINDLTSVMAMSKASECRSLLEGYSDRLEGYARIMYDEDIDASRKRALIQAFFQDFDALVGLSVEQDGEVVSSAYDGAALEAHGLSQGQLREQIDARTASGSAFVEGRVLVENSTLVASFPTVTITQVKVDRGRRFTISATIRLDDLLHLSARARPFKTYLIDSNGALLADPDPERVASREAALLPADIELLRGRGSASATRTYERDGQMLIAGHAPVGIGDAIVVVEVPQAAIYLASRTLLQYLLVVSLGLLAAAVVVSTLGSRGITRPIVRLLEATHAIGRGHFDIHVEVTSRDEIGTLAESFNQMAMELTEREEALKRAQGQLAQSEKLAALGELGAAIAHEVKNPLAGILGCAQLSLRKPGDRESVERNLKLIDKETKRCKSIVENLLKFARPEKPEMASIAINDVVSDTVSIVRHQLEMHSVALELDLAAELPPIHGNANQLQQVLMNLVINAQQAMSTGGHVTISTTLLEGVVSLRVRDDGPGMSEEVRQKVFDPFFTTKPRGVGTGLGLSVSFGIVRDHKGEIVVESEAGEGTEFIISLPIAAPGSDEREVAA